MSSAMVGDRDLTRGQLLNPIRKAFTQVRTPSDYSSTLRVEKIRKVASTRQSVEIGLDVLPARSRRTCQPPRRVLDIVVVPAGPKKAKSTSNVPRSAPVPLAERCDAGPWRVGGDESRARSGAERRCASHFLRSFEGQKMRSRCQMRQGPRQYPSLNAATAEVGGRWEGYGLCEARRGASLPLYRAANRSAVLVQRRFDAIQRPLRASKRVPCLKLFRAPQQLNNNLRRLLQDQSDSEATYRRPATEDCTEIASLLVAFFRPASSFPPPLGDDPFPSPSIYIHDSATLFEPPAPLATPSILVSTDFNISQPPRCRNHAMSM
ncbi:hypothetical protein EV715DRAFT_268466 [Schizophyllum commune]